MRTVASDDDDDDDEQYHSDPKFKFRQAAAHIRRGLDLFSNIHTLVNRGMMRHALDHNDLPLSQEDGEAIMYVTCYIHRLAHRFLGHVVITIPL